MDKLGQQVYNNKELLYKYKDKVDIPCLGMVDDIMAIQKCSDDALKINAVINGFIESKKLSLSKTKCHRIHVQKKVNQTTQCPKLKVHDGEMCDSSKEKYLGDIIDKSGKISNTVEDRRNKGFGIVSEILAIVNDIPLGKYKMEIGLMLRQAMLLNGILFNSEAWHAISEQDIKLLEGVDEHLLRSLVGGHSKTPLEFLYLEAGAIPIRFLISCRRMIYLQTLLRRPDGELTKRVYLAQKEAPTYGDYFNLVKTDWEMMDEPLDEAAIVATSADAHKRKVKAKIRMSAFQFLQNKKKQHSKVKNVEYTKLETQKYMTSPLFNDQDVSLLYAMRSRALECKSNYKSKYKNNDLVCSICSEEEDDQPHIMQCKVLNSKLASDDVVREKIEYNDIFRNHQKQKVIVTLYEKLLKIRKTMLEDQQNDPSTSDMALKNCYNLQQCIVNSSSGN